jgi:predicted exporter
MPSVLAILLSICILTWFGQPITFFHMLSFFIVTGLGLDYTIFNLNTDNNKEMRPVMFSFLTSFVGFGLLAFTSFFLIKSMGITLGLGLLLSYLISLFLFRNYGTK